MIMRKTLTVLLFIIMVILLFVFQPSMMFDKEGNLKNFDYTDEGSNTTLLPMILIVPFLALLCFLIVLLIEMVIT